MNFYGHLAVGLRYRDDPAFLLGCMLPDFAGMARLRRLRAPEHPQLHSGIRFHHETDAAFHAAPLFARSVAAGLIELERAGVARGTARAVAHVGLELLLDGLLYDGPASPGLRAYRAALAAAQEPELLARVETDRGAADPRLTSLIERLQRAPVPAAYREPAFITERLQHMLAHRPRLAMGTQDGPPVTIWLAYAKTALAGDLDALLAQVHAGLAAQAQREPDGERS